MAQVQSNDISLKSSRETSPGVASTSWLDQFYRAGSLKAAPIIRKVVANRVSKDGNPEKGATVGVDSGVSYEADATFESLYEHADAACFSTYNYATRFFPTSVTAIAYVVPSGGALTEGTIIVARGFANAANNGVKVVGAASDADEIKTSGLVAETVDVPDQNATVDVIGWQGAAGDIRINASLEITSEVAGVDFTTLGWSPGQRLKLGGPSTIAASRFATCPNVSVRIATIAAHLITVDREDQALLEDAGGGKTIWLLSGPFARTRLSVDDADYLKRSYTHEIAYENLQNPDGTGDMYKYATGQYLDELKLNLTTEGVVSLGLTFVGFDCEPPSTVRLTGVSDSRRVVSKKLLNCSSDIATMLIAETDETVRSTYFETLSLTIKNNLSPKHVIGDEGAVLMNIGKVMVTVDAKLMFTHAEIPEAIRENRTLATWFGVFNDDGGIFVDIPQMTLEGGDEDLPENEVASITVKANAHKDDTLGYCASITLFPYYPE